MFDIYSHRYKKEFKILNLKLNKIMATLDEVLDRAVDLQATVDAEQAQIQKLVDGQTATIVSLEAHITELQALVNGAPTPEQLQAVVDKLKATQDDIASTIPDPTTTTTTTVVEETTTTTTVV